MKLNILVFPCGSEIGLEVHRSLRYSSHVVLFGASSTEDHGRFVYEKYTGDLPLIDDASLVARLSEIGTEHKIDAIYPTMDKVISVLKKSESTIGCKIISSNSETSDICLSKKLTYTLLEKTLAVPRTFPSPGDIEKFPVFIKPVIGYGSRGTCIAKSLPEVEMHLANHRSIDMLISEYLPGKEFTVDCFTDRHGTLRFSGARKRARVVNGISVNTAPVKSDDRRFQDITCLINARMTLRGAWFFQVKENHEGDLVLMEVAARLGGSSSLYRNTGINFALLSIFDAFDIDVEIMKNDYGIELDRSLSSRYRIDLAYKTIYVDYDDCLLINGKINICLVSFLYAAFNAGKKIVLLTKHQKEISASLLESRMTSLFDEVIVISKIDSKWRYINPQDAIFIDDSFSERAEVRRIHKIAVFSPDMVGCLFNEAD